VVEYLSNKILTLIKAGAARVKLIFLASSGLINTQLLIVELPTVNVVQLPVGQSALEEHVIEQ